MQQMFSSIAHRYDRANAILSVGIDRSWRRTTVKLSGAKPGSKVLDCATGTGDLALAFKKQVGGSGVVVGTDLNEAMLAYAPEKAKAQHLDISFSRADVQELPFADHSFDIVSIAFGIRNVDDPSRGLTEMARVCVPGGRVVVLEFGQPRGPMGWLYRQYSKHIIPRIGAMVTGRRSPYEYLPSTAARFPAGQAFVDLMNGTQRFASVTAHALTGGVAYVYVGHVR